MVHRARPAGLALLLLTGLLATVSVGAGAAPGRTLHHRQRGAAPSVRTVTVAELKNPVGFTFTPKGRIVYAERDTGAIRFLDPATGKDRRFYRFKGVDSEGERGTLGVALHPGWPDRPFVYVYVTRGPGSAPLRNQLIRLRIVDGRGRNPRVLLQSPIGSRANHNGGRIAFGPDGKLYVVIGDGGEDPSTAQDLTDEPRGKILRLNPDGSVPADNPFADSPVWSFGHRNSIGFAFDPQTGDLWETENGPDCNDEINLIQAGGNYAWGPTESCPDTNQDGPDPKLPPIWSFTPTLAVTGTAFCDGCGLGAFYDGHLLIGCANGDCTSGPGPLLHAALSAGRDDFAGAPQRVPVTNLPGSDLLDGGRPGWAHLRERP